MKSIAGSLRLDLAAFRELEAFAQLGTELDKATQSQLDRGYRMVEVLKQPQFQPMNVADQVMIIFAGTKGYLDKVPRQAGCGLGAAVPARSCRNRGRRCATRWSSRRKLTPEIEKRVWRAAIEFSSRSSRRDKRAGQMATNTCDRQAPQGDPQHPQDHADHGADRHGALQEGDGPRHRGRRLHAQDRASWPPTSAASATNVTHPLLEKREQVKNSAAAGHLASNRGLCGGYNACIFREAARLPPQDRGRTASTLHLELSGKRAIAYCSLPGLFPPQATYTHFEDKPRFEDVDVLANRYIDDYIAGEIDRVDVAYMKFLNAARQMPVVETLLPLSASAHEAGRTGEVSRAAEGSSTSSSPGRATSCRKSCRCRSRSACSSASSTPRSASRSPAASP